jgi:hypothetical protein
VAAVAAGSQHMRPKRKNGKKTRFCRSAEAVAAAVLEPSPPSFPTVIPMMAGSGDDDGLAALHEQVALASSAAISASDLDYAFQLQVSEAIQASLRGQSSPNAAAASSSASPQAAPFPLQEPPSDAACALTLQAADFALAEQDHRDAEACRAAHALAAASLRVAAHAASLRAPGRALLHQAAPSASPLPPPRHPHLWTMRSLGWSSGQMRLGGASS